MINYSILTIDSSEKENFLKSNIFNQTIKWKKINKSFRGIIARCVLKKFNHLFYLYVLHIRYEISMNHTVLSIKKSLKIN